jgi:hypothetical protein
MQRDVYAAMIKKKTKSFIPINIMQLSGEITHEQIFDEVFDGHRLRRLVLSTNMCNVDPSAGPKLPRDIVVTSFNMLARIHKPHFQYKLLPLLCSGVTAFAALQGICGSPGSPFQIENRRDPLSLKYSVNGPAHRDQIVDFFFDQYTEEEKKLPNSSKKLLLTTVDFDGVMIAKVPGPNPATVAGLMCLTDQQLSPKVITEYHNIQRLFLSSLYAKFTQSVPLYNDVMRANQRYFFLAVKQPVTVGRPSILALAKEKNFFVYEQRGDEFLFAAE